MSGPLTVGEVCAGYGGLGMGLAMLTPTRLAWVADIEPGPTRVLAHHWPHVPNHGDITRVDWESVSPWTSSAGVLPAKTSARPGCGRACAPAPAPDCGRPWSEQSRSSAPGPSSGRT